MQDKTSTSGSAMPEAICKVGMKIPPFWAQEPALWFAQIEAQFLLSGITADTTKFYHVIAQLDHHYAAEVKDVITAPPQEDKYEKLKKELIKRLSESQEKKVKQLLVHEELGDRKPSQFLRHLQTLAGQSIPDSFLRTLWSSRLPHNIQTVIATQPDAALETVAELADKVYEIAPPTPVLASIAPGASSSTVSDLAKQIEELTRQVSALQGQDQISACTPSQRSMNHVRERTTSCSLPTDRRSILTAGSICNSTLAYAAYLDGGVNDRLDGKLDVPVEQLEKLKLAESKEGGELKSEHVEYHRLDSVKENGELVSRLEEHGSSDSVGDEKPRVHASSQLDVPAENIHRVLVQDGAHVSVHDGIAATAAPSEEITTKVFHGAARLVQPGSATLNPTNGHTAARRAFNADITKETKNNVDHYSSYAGVQYSPLDMAEYVFWTGDERGVTTAIEDFLQEGLMSKEEAIAFLQEIKFNIDYLRAHYSQNLKAAEESAQQEKLRTMLMEQASAKDYQYRNPVALQSFPFGNSPDIIRSIASKNWELSNNLSPIPLLPVSSDLRPEPVKRFDPMLQTNIISTSDYDRDGPVISEEEYEEMMEKLKAADTLYTEYTLEEIIYQLAKMMFSQSLSHDPASARAATQRFMAFLELEAERGQLSRTIEKKVLDVMIAALTDTIGDHPELLQAREGLAVNPANRIMRQFLEASASEPSMSRAILAAYKDELLKGPPLHKFSFPERN